MSDEAQHDGPAILEGLRQARAAVHAGDNERARQIADQLRAEHGNTPVDAVIGALKFGFITLEED